jgi:hypothetical protein
MGRGTGRTPSYEVSESSVFDTLGIYSIPWSSKASLHVLKLIS